MTSSALRSEKWLLVSMSKSYNSVSVSQRSANNCTRPLLSLLCQYRTATTRPMNTINKYRVLFSYRLNILTLPETHHRAMSGHSCCWHNCWNCKRAKSSNPWQHHAQWRHPVAIELPVTDCMDCLEVPFERDNHNTNLFGVHTKTSCGRNLWIHA